MATGLDIFHRLPGWTRNLAAGARGLQLRRLRYGGDFERLTEMVLERDTWSAEKWEKWQADRLAEILERAAVQVPYYRRHWAERRRRGDRASWAYIENWPVLEKPEIRRHNREFVADGVNIRKMFRDHTSGTTGTSIDIWLTTETVRLWYAMFEARCRRWYGVSRDDRWAILGGQLVAAAGSDRPPFWVWNAPLNQLYLSAYHIRHGLVDHYFAALRRHRIVYLLGYSSAIYSLARSGNREDCRSLRLKVIITNAEPLLAHQRECIEDAFGCPVRETYGMAEAVAAGSECEHGKLHSWPDAGIVELGNPTAGVSDLLCTGLVNADMPLIRYRIGDCGSAVRNEECACGRPLPLLENIHGRSDDVLYTKDGRAIGRLDPVFKNDLAIAEAQIIQTSLNEVIVRVVPEAGFDSRAEADLIARIRERMGNIDTRIDRVTSIPRTARGKFKAVICELSPAELEQVKA